MDTNIPQDEGAGVGKSGVETPWETGNLGKGDGDWQCRPRGSSGPDALNHSRKNPGNTGGTWDRPWEKKNSNDGGDNKQAY